MRRREFIGLIGGAAAGWPHAAFAQSTSKPVIGFLSSESPEPNAHLIDAFWQGLAAAGYAEGRNVAIEYRWAEGRYDRLPALAVGLVRHPVDVVAVFDNTAAARAARDATSTIPIVFAVGTDPVKFGLVDSLRRPGGNVTGIVSLTVGLGVKRLQVLRELLPTAARLGLLVNPNNPAAESETADVLSVARTSGLAIHILPASREEQVGAAFAAARREGVGGVLVLSEPFFSSHARQIAGLAMQAAMPVIDAYREFAVAGGLMSYGASRAEARRDLGRCVGRILNGEKPADLPVQQSTKIELAINLKTAKTLGLAVPTSLLVRADEVIE